MIRARLVGVAALTIAAVGGATACNGDDDDGGSTTTTLAPTTPPTRRETVATVATTSPPTDPPTTPAATAPPTTVPDVEAVKAQIAADYERSAALRDEWVRNPTLDDLDQRAATISAPGSVDYEGLVALIRQLVERGERLVPGEPDLNSVTVELVELPPDDPTVATVTVCNVFNDRRVAPDGQTIGDTGVLSAIRFRQQVEQTANGWLPASAFEPLAAAEGVTTCPAS